MANAFWPTAVVGEADSVNSVSASACHIGVTLVGQKALLHGNDHVWVGDGGPSKTILWMSMEVQS